MTATGGEGALPSAADPAAAPAAAVDKQATNPVFVTEPSDVNVNLLFSSTCTSSGFVV